MPARFNGPSVPEPSLRQSACFSTRWPFCAPRCPAISGAAFRLPAATHRGRVTGWECPSPGRSCVLGNRRFPCGAGPPKFYCFVDCRRWCVGPLTEDLAAMRGEMAKQFPPLHAGSHFNRDGFASRCSRAFSGRQFAIGLQHQAQSFLEVSASFRQRAPLRVHARDFFNVGDIPSPALFNDGSEFALHVCTSSEILVSFLIELKKHATRARKSVECKAFRLGWPLVENHPGSLCHLFCHSCTRRSKELPSVCRLNFFH